MASIPRLPKTKILLLAFVFPICVSCSSHSSFFKSDPQLPNQDVSVEKPVSVQSRAIPEDERGAAALIEEDQQNVALAAEQKIQAIDTSMETDGQQKPNAIPGAEQEGKQEKAVSAAEVTEGDSQATAPKPRKKSGQEMLDSALEFCQTANYFWERGELDSALNALDQAYSLILKINHEDDSDILQQKEDLRFTISKRIIEVYTSRFTVANGYRKPIPLVMNRHVERALSLYKGRDRQFFLDAYRRSGKYRPAIVSALKEAGLPEELSWLPLIESGFKIRALSRARALGLWQFVASTGYKFGLTRDHWVDERMDPERSTQAAIAYLKELHQIFGDWATVLAAYNCGEGRVLRCIRRQRINYLDNFWDLYERLPVETVFYVPKFMAVLHILNDPKAHGFDLAPGDQEIETDTVTFDKQVHLKTVSKHLRVPYKLLQDLNPALRRNCTPNRPYSLKVPKGEGEVLLSKLDDIPVYRPRVPDYVMHRVRRGECLSVIAERYRTSVRAIMALNGLRSSHYIKVGWRLKIPTRRRYTSRRKPSPPVSMQMRGEHIEYVVRRGDSLWRIANRFTTTTKAIRSLNNLTSTRLHIGQVLLIPQEVNDSTAVRTTGDTVPKGNSAVMTAQKGKKESVSPPEAQ